MMTNNSKDYNIRHLPVVISPRSEEKFWHFDRKITILNFACSLGIIALLDYLGLVVFVLSLVVFPILFSYFVNPTSTKLENGREIILNSRGIDITPKKDDAKYWLLMIIGVSYSFFLMPNFIFEFTTKYNAVGYLIKFAPAYIIFFGFFFLMGIPISIIGKTGPDSNNPVHYNSNFYNSSTSSFNDNTFYDQNY